MSQRVYLTQAHCPKGHAICAFAAEIEEPPDAATEAAFLRAANGRARKVIDALLAERSIAPWCAICESPRAEWRFETGRTAWRTIDEAWAPLREAEQKNLQARAHFIAKRRTAAGN